MGKPDIWEEANYYWNCPECNKVNDADDVLDTFLVCENCEYIYDEDSDNGEE